MHIYPTTAHTCALFRAPAGRWIGPQAVYISPRWSTPQVVEARRS